MVESFYWSLKAALTARLDGPCWMDDLPVVLLGIRSTSKDSINAAWAQFVYGTNVRIPGYFLPPPVDNTQEPDSDFIRELQCASTVCRSSHQNLQCQISTHNHTFQVALLRHILSPLHNLSWTTKRAALTAHFVAHCIHCRPKVTKCAAVHGTFCRPREREREREREFIMLLKVISWSPQKSM